VRKIKKAIIPAAGLGTRFLPATKAMPKEMLPVVDKPMIQYIVEEAVQSGIEDIIIVSGKGKRAIEDHFDINHELEDNLLSKGKVDLLEKVRHISDFDIHYIRQKAPKGLGHAVWSARKFIGDEPFAVLLGDDIIQSESPAIGQLMEQFETTQRSVVGVQQVDESQTHRYGIVTPGDQNGRRYQVTDFVEKPAPGTAPSNLGIVGRYVFTPEIFSYLSKQEIGAGGEIQLTDAIQQLNQQETVYAYDFAGKRYDVGEKLGFIQTNIDFALQDEEIADEVRKYLKELMMNKEEVK